VELPLPQLDLLLFAVLPYVVVVSFLILIAARRYHLPPFSRIPEPRPAPTTMAGIGERILLGYGILVVLGGHFLAFLIPEQVLLWNSDPLRLYVLELTGIVFALMTLAGLLLAIGRRLVSSSARHGMHVADWLFLLLIGAAVANGLLVALFFPWGSSWFATSLAPYLRSLVRLDPDIRYVSSLPIPVKAHVALAYVLVGLLPFTRLVVPFVTTEGERIRTGVGKVVTALLIVGVAFSGLGLVARLHGAHLPGNDQGYEPVQPIAFSHRLHAGDMQISCVYCHSAAERSRHAGIPAAAVCMNCHRFVTANINAVRAEYELARQEKRPAKTIVNDELAKLYAALALDERMQRDPKKQPTPIRWAQVDNLPAFTCFDHRAHVSAKVSCQECHGPVETMERVRQVNDFSMGWCVNCHREAVKNGLAAGERLASTDCVACHH
jgi:nitrate reductase gamma subunit